MTSRTVVRRPGLAKIRKTDKDLPTSCVSFIDDDNVYNLVVLYIRHCKARPLLGLRRARRVKSEKLGRVWLDWFYDEIFPITIDEAFAFADGSFIPAGYDKETDSFTKWEGKLEEDEPNFWRGVMIRRLLKHNQERELTEKQIACLVEDHIFKQATWFYQSCKHFKAK